MLPLSLRKRKSPVYMMIAQAIVIYTDNLRIMTRATDACIQWGDINYGVSKDDFSHLTKTYKGDITSENTTCNETISLKSNLFLV